MIATSNLKTNFLFRSIIQYAYISSFFNSSTEHILNLIFISTNISDATTEILKKKNNYLSMLHVFRYI